MRGIDLTQNFYFTYCWHFIFGQVDYCMKLTDFAKNSNPPPQVRLKQWHIHSKDNSRPGIVLIKNVKGTGKLKLVLIILYYLIWWHSGKKIKKQLFLVFNVRKVKSILFCVIYDYIFILYVDVYYNIFFIYNILYYIYNHLYEFKSMILINTF